MYLLDYLDGDAVLKIGALFTWERKGANEFITALSSYLSLFELHYIMIECEDLTWGISSLWCSELPPVATWFSSKLTPVAMWTSFGSKTPPVATWFGSRLLMIAPELESLETWPELAMCSMGWSGFAVWTIRSLKVEVGVKRWSEVWSDGELITTVAGGRKGWATLKNVHQIWLRIKKTVEKAAKCLM